MKKLLMLCLLLMLGGCQAKGQSMTVFVEPLTKTEFYEQSNISYKLYEVEFDHEYLMWYHDNLLDLPTTISHIEDLDETFYYLSINDQTRYEIASLLGDNHILYVIPMFQTWLFEVTDVITDYEDGVLFVNVSYDLLNFPATHCVLIVLEIESLSSFEIIFNGFEMNALD